MFHLIFFNKEFWKDEKKATVEKIEEKEEQ
jgi:hypothetical protein